MSREGFVFKQLCKDAFQKESRKQLLINKQTNTYASAFEKQTNQLKPISIMPLFLRACGNISCVFQTERGHLSQLQNRQRMVFLSWVVSWGKHESRGHQYGSLFSGVTALEIQSCLQICLLGIGNNAYDYIQFLGSLVPKATHKEV